MMEQDKADRLTDRIEARATAECALLYARVQRNASKRAKPLLSELDALEAKKPPAVYKTPQQQDEWRENERRCLIRKSGIANAIARELAAAGMQSAVIINRAMDDVDRINRVGDDIG